LKVENSEDKAGSLIEKYKNSSIFKQNMKEIVAIYKNAIEFGKDFDFVNENIVSLLAVWINKRNKREFLDFISDLNLINFLIEKKGEQEIDLELWAYGKILTQNLKESKKLSSLKNNISNDFTKKFENKFLKLGSPTKKDRDEFEKFISKIENEKDRVLKIIENSLKI
jgi:hypothetical protein